MSLKAKAQTFSYFIVSVGAASLALSIVGTTSLLNHQIETECKQGADNIEYLFDWGKIQIDCPPPNLLYDSELSSMDSFHHPPSLASPLAEESPPNSPVTDQENPRETLKF